MVRHHPDDELLLDYAAGGAARALSVLLASHTALCPTCRRRVRTLEALGGALLDGLPEPQPCADDVPAGLLARLAATVAPLPAPERLAAGDARTRRLVPEPLRGYIGADLERLPWRWAGPGVRRHVLAGGGGGRPLAQLLHVAAGHAVPQHRHTGLEAILVLDGAFADGGERFGRGDVAIADPAVEHRPSVVGDASCLCFLVAERPIRFTGRIGRLLNLLDRG